MSNPKTKTLKPKKCKVCEIEFIPKNSLQKVCSTKCALDLARQNAQKERDKAEKPLRVAKRGSVGI